MIRPVLSLNGSEMNAVLALEASVKAADGFDAGLQKEKGLNHFRDLTSWFLAYDREALIGVLSVFEPRTSEAEISGLIDPAYRRRGVFKALNEAAESELRRFAIGRVLYSVNRKSDPGRLLALALGCTHMETEYNMSLPAKAPLKEPAGAVRIGRMQAEDLAEMAAISAAAFRETPAEAASMLSASLASADRELYGAYYGDRLAGIASLYLDSGTAMINGLAIDPTFQGRGAGQDFMLQLLQRIRRRGLQAILDVHSDNAAAYGLYKKLGFREDNMQDYYEKTL